MLTFDSFTGINNVLPSHRLTGADLLGAENVDIDRTGQITRRHGVTKASDECHKNLFEAPGYLLSTRGGRLVATHDGGAEHVVHPAIGPERIWYGQLPDGRVMFSNGLLQGITDGIGSVERSVPAPDSLGAPDTAFGSLFPGKYRYYLTHVRLIDGAESPAVEAPAVEILQGGLRIDGIPERAGHAVNVYLSAQDGEGAYLAGQANGGTFEFGGSNAALVTPCRTIGARPAPVGTITAYWRGRVLIASGDVLWACRTYAPHLSDWRDFKPLGAPITAVLPVDDGIYVGTSKGLVFLGGTSWDGLVFRDTRRGPVVPGSGVAAPGDQIGMGDGKGGGDAVLCIAGGHVVAGFSGGQTVVLTDDRYRTDVKEVCATFRVVDEIPQYVAVPQ
ncbi:hypothetical protein ASF19_20140 [Acidovorax sp. Leaf84]|uniref:hypothetical protein n=1 Tax=Acidovorax sp. Leaf84 TaxID=1736240 RepID=UPI0006FED64F|nr:hypothetical protein [Acidovorax sp. Leaf84]KQO38087.1 hypothetical protein ASF19_20140 [Acidovorax sp. Leaf84]